MRESGADDWSGNDELRLDGEEMRRLGYRAIDAVVEHITTLADRPVSRTASRRELEARLREPPPVGPTPPEAVLDAALRDVLADVIHVDHPRNFGFVPGPSNFVGVVGDLLASGFNVFAGTWLEASGPAQVELVTLDWLKSLCDLPDEAAGLFVSGGSAANLTCLVVAREEKLDGDLSRGVAYYSDQTHSSVERALRVLGLRGHQLRKLASDADLRLSVDDLERAIASDRVAGARPFLVVANAGTTNTGAVDPLPHLVQLCRRENLWLHVDGAYGAAAVLTDRGKRLLRGLGDVDSLSLDPHKWLFQPYEAGTAFVREGHLLKKHFHILPAYLEDVQAGQEEVNFSDLGVQLTRSFRALKLWMTVRVFGLDHLRRAVERGLDLAEKAEVLLRERGDFEILAPAGLGIVAFRFVPPGARHLEGLDVLNRRLAKAVIEDGFALVSSTVIQGKTALRMCPINPRTTERDLLLTIERIAELAARRDCRFRDDLLARGANGQHDDGRGRTCDALQEDGMPAHICAGSLVAALLMTSGANAEARRLTDAGVERLLESIDKEVPACAEQAGQGPWRDLAAAARTMRERFDEKSSANEEVLAFLLKAQEIPEESAGACASLREGVARLAEAYHVDRNMSPPLWRARRMNDLELARVLASLGEVAVPFTRELAEVVKLLDPCTVVEGEREDIVARAKGLAAAAEALRKAVQMDRDPSEELDALLSRAKDIRASLERHSIARVLRDTWGPVERDLSLVATAFQEP